jgi:hypothetical protein
MYIATFRKVVGSIPNKFIRFLKLYSIFGAALWTCVDSASKRNEDENSSWRMKKGNRSVRLIDSTAVCMPIV